MQLFLNKWVTYNPERRGDNLFHCVWRRGDRTPSQCQTPSDKLPSVVILSRYMQLMSVTAVFLHFLKSPRSPPRLPFTRRVPVFTPKESRHGQEKHTWSHPSICLTTPLWMKRKIIFHLLFILFIYFCRSVDAAVVSECVSVCAHAALHAFYSEIPVQLWLSSASFIL